MEQERKQAMEKQESKKALSNFSTASTATDYNQLRGTDSEGKVKIAKSFVYLAKATPSRDDADVYLERAEEQLQTIGVLLGGISSQERAVQ